MTTQPPSPIFCWRIQLFLGWWWVFGWSVQRHPNFDDGTRSPGSRFSFFVHLKKRSMPPKQNVIDILKIVDDPDIQDEIKEEAKSNTLRSVVLESIIS